MTPGKGAALFLTFVLLFCIQADGWSHRTVEAELLSLKGTVRVRIASSGKWLQARKNQKLYARDELQTHQHSGATLAMAGGRFVVGPLTRVIIPEQRTGRSPAPSRLNVLTGKILILLIGAHPLEIGTTGAVTAVRGTTFLVEADPDGRTTVTVLDGMVEFHNELGRVMLSAGEQSTAAPGMAPTRPMRVDPSSYIEWEATTENLWLDFEKRHYPDETPESLQKRLQEAEAEAAAAPHDLQAMVHWADLLCDAGRPDVAEAVYREAATAAPDDPGVLLRLGYSLLAQADAAQAAQVFARAAALAPEEASPLAGQALAAAAESPDGKLDLASELVQRALALNPTDPDAVAAAGLIHIRRGETAKALRVLQTPDVEDYRLPIYLSLVQLSLGQGEKAADNARRAVAMAPASGLAHQALGTAEFYAGDLQQAAEAAQSALKLAPNSAATRLLAANVAIAQGDLAAGRSAVETALVLDPRLAPAYQVLGMTALAQNDLRTAHKAFSRAVKLHPQMVSAHSGLGLTYARQGQLGQALLTLQAAAAVDTRQAAVHNNIGVVYMQMGRLSEAESEFKEALALQPDWALVHANLALAYLEQNRFAEAVQAGELAVRLGEDSARVHTTLGRVYLRQDRLNRAWAALRRAVELDGDYALARLHLAEVHIRLGRPHDALRERYRGISLQPSVIVDNRDYARTEMQVFAGDGHGAFMRFNTRGDMGQNSYYAAADYERGDWGRPDSDYDRRGFMFIAGRQTSPDHTRAFIAGAQRDRRDQPGPALSDNQAADPNASSTFDALECSLLGRAGSFAGGDVTFKLGSTTHSLRERNPDAAAANPRPFPRIKTDRRGVSAEVRYDRDIGPDGRLTAGLAATRERRRISGAIAAPGPPGSTPTLSLTPFGDTQYRNLASGYLECEHTFDPGTRILLGGKIAAADDMRPVIRPRISLRKDVSKTGTVVLLTRPVLADDTADLAPVDPWALRPWQSPTELARGGFSQSYELQYELLPADGSLLRLGVFHREMRNLLVDLHDPAWSQGTAPAVIGKGAMQGAEMEWEHRLGSTMTAGVWARYADSKNDDASGRKLPYQPQISGMVRVDYLAADGWRGSLSWQQVGRRYADTENTVRLPSYGVLNLGVARQLDLHRDVFVNVENVLDRHYEYFSGYPGRDRRIQGGIRYRF